MEPDTSGLTQYSKFLHTAVQWLKQNTTLNIVNGLPVYERNAVWPAAVINTDRAGSNPWRLEISNYDKQGKDYVNIGNLTISNVHGWDKDGCREFIKSLEESIWTHQPRWM